MTALHLLAAVGPIGFLAGAATAYRYLEARIERIERECIESIEDAHANRPPQ